MQPRILDIHFCYPEEFDRIWSDAGTPPPDRSNLRDDMHDLVDAYDPRQWLRTVREHPLLLEFIVRGSTSGHRYGMMFIDMGHAADAFAYWRDPPLYLDSRAPQAHGFSRAHAIELAIRRLEVTREQ